MIAAALLIVPAAATAEVMSWQKHPWLSTNNLMVANTDGTAQREIPNTAGGSSPTVSPDGLRIAYVRVTQSTRDAGYYYGSLYVINVDGSGRRQVYASAAADPAWSPAGDLIAFTTENSGPESDIAVVWADSSGGWTPVNWQGRQQRAAWGPDGRTLVFDTDHDPTGLGLMGDVGNIWKASIETDIYAPSYFAPAPLVPVANRTNECHYGSDSTVSKDWKVAWTAGTGQHVCISDIDGAPPYEAAGSSGSPCCYTTPSYSASGTKLIYTGAGTCPTTVYAAGSGWAPSGCTRDAEFQPYNLKDYFVGQLARYAPTLKYTAGEPYFADAANQATDWVVDGSTYGEPLKDATENLIAGTALLASKSRPCQRLTLKLLGSVYLKPDGTPCGTRDFFLNRSSSLYVSGDHLDLPGTDSDGLYSYNYTRVTSVHPEWRDTYYGRVVQGASGRFYLQYWFWYYYNSKSGLGFGLHEGDWEMVQIGFDGISPSTVTMAQHANRTSCPWSATEHPNDVLNVYVAKDSHASYFNAGDDTVNIVVDEHHGDNGHVTTGARLIDITAAGGWLSWPGRWGATVSGNDLESNSPTGPAQHDQWGGPDAFENSGAGNSCPTLGSAARAGVRRRRPIRPIPRIAAPHLRITSDGPRERDVSVGYEVTDWQRVRRHGRLWLRVSVYRRGWHIPVVRTVRLRNRHGAVDVAKPYKARDVAVRAQILDRHGRPVTREGRTG